MNPQNGKGTADRIKDRKKFLDNYEKVFGNNGVQAGSWMTDPHTGESIPKYEWYKKYGRKKLGEAPYIQADIEPYQSPIDDSYIGSRRAQRYDLEKNGCRIYEGREQEQKEADRIKEEKWRKLEETLDKSMPQVANDLKYQNIQKETHIKSGWLIGED